MRLAVEQLKRGFTIHHGKLRTRLMSIRSLMHYLSFQVYDRGITLTPSYVRKDEVLRYLLDTYGEDKLEPIKSYSHGTFEVDNYLMLEFGSKVVTDDKLRKDLDLLSSYYRTRMTEKNISMYLSKKTSLRGNVTVKPFAKFEFGRVKFKGVNDLSYHDNYYTVGNAKEIYVSHIFYDALTDYAGLKRDREWTFRKELTREEENKYILLILDGSIKPNTDIGKKVHSAYLKVLVNRTPNLIFEETFMQRMEEIDAITEEIINSGKQLKGVTDYSVIYEDNGEEITHVPVYAGYYAWDYDYDKPLDDINRLRGVGGEFTREVQPDRLPYEVIVDGVKTDMYPVELESADVMQSSLISMLEKEYNDSIGNSTEEEEEVKEVADYRITPEDLIPSGVPYIGEDDYVRVLNATDLELNGDAVMYMSNMFPKLNYKAQQKAIAEYYALEESEYSLELHVKTVVDEESRMYIKQHLKYYAPNNNNEQVVEGLLMLNEDMQIPTLHTILSGDTIVHLTEDALERKRVGVYVEEADSMYAYKFIAMFNVETKEVVRVTDSVTGVDRRGRTLQALPLTAFELSEEKEELLVEMIRKSIVGKVVNHSENRDFYRQVLKDSMQYAQ